MEISDYMPQNVWWRKKESIEDDKHISELKSKKYKWHPEILDEINLVPKNIYTLRGPRQIGKTTLCKLIIKSLLKKIDDPKAIFYASCDLLVDFKELVDLIKKYLEFSLSQNIKENYIFIDEVSSIKNWQKAIKFLVDSNELKNTALFLTGSHTLDIKHSIERLPGRVGRHGKNILLLPLSFREFIELINPKLSKKIKKIQKIDQNEIKNNSPIAFENELKILFNQYLITGGFPLSINEFFTHKKISDYIFEIYRQWIFGDIVKWGKQEKISKQIIRAAIKRQGSLISWDSFAKEAEIKSHKTVSAYIEDLENMFVFFILYYLDLSKKIVDYNKNKKVYFFDPFIYHIFNKIFYLKNYDITPSLVESVVVSNISKFLHQKNINVQDINENIFYWKNKKEVDIIVKYKDDIIPIEVKYQNKLSKDDYKSLYEFSKGIIATKNTYEQQKNYLAVPIHVFLAML